jgi:hypothetical protein
MARYLIFCGICLLISAAIKAQEKALRDTIVTPPNFVAQKLSVKLPGPAIQLGDAPKSSDTSAKSIVYLGARSKDTFNLDLPKMKNRGVDFRVQARKKQPLYWETLNY